MWGGEVPWKYTPLYEKALKKTKNVLLETTHAAFYLRIILESVFNILSQTIIVPNAGTITQIKQFKNYL